MQEILDGVADESLHVLVVWEPILPTDWAPPSSGVLARTSDRRAIQFWDRTHHVALALGASLHQQPKPECCDARGVLWDVAAVFPKDALWTDSAPRAVLLNGPVVMRKGQLADAVWQHLRP